MIGKLQDRAADNNDSGRLALLNQPAGEYHAARQRAAKLTNMKS